MSETRLWDVITTVVRTTDSGGSGQGCGNSKTLFVGRSGASGRRNYDSFLKPTVDWTDVGQIVSATLVVYTASGSGSAPYIWLQRLLDSFSEGNNADGDFDASDYTTAKGSTSAIKKVHPSKVVDTLNRLDVTSFIEDIAPKTVRRRNGKPGGKATNYGIGLFGTTKATEFCKAYSEEADDAGLRPQIELVYTLGPTTPDDPSNLEPAGSVTGFDTFEGDFLDVRPTDKLRSTDVEVYVNAAVATGQTVNKSPIWSRYGFAASDTDILDARSRVTRDTLTLTKNTAYKWRLRQTDQEGRKTLWTSLVSVTETADAPPDPILTPSAGTFATLDGVLFRGGTVQANANDYSLIESYQVQMSLYPEGSARWDEPTSLVWDTGRVFQSSKWEDGIPLGAQAGRTGTTSWSTLYGGEAIDAAAYYFRGRQWDRNGGVSDWSYESLTLTDDFDIQPGSQSSIQIDPRAPWRVVIMGMGALRGPGEVLAILEDAKNVGGATVYNSPGGGHWTLLKDHPQISVIEPKQTHYSLQLYGGNGWREVYAGLVWDIDATEKDVVFTGLDYLGLYDNNQDERWDPAKTTKSYTKGGSYYSKVKISTVITDQLKEAKKKKNSSVGFITVGAVTLSPDTEKVTIYSTMEPTLSFVAGLIDSHKQGTGKKTRIQVRQKTGGGYEVVVQDDPGVTRNDLRLSYGELLQGYRVIPFGADWAQHTNVIGRAKNGLSVWYKSGTAGDAPGISPTTWGRIAQTKIIDGVDDQNDLQRRQKQAAIHAGKLGKSIAVGIRQGFLQPFDGYDIGDAFPVAIVDGAINTDNFGSGYWVCYAVAWEASDDGSSNVTLTLSPREDTVAPDADLIDSRPISTQPEWQMGWAPPNSIIVTSKFWIDNNTGIVYYRDDETNEPVSITGTA